MSSESSNKDIAGKKHWNSSERNRHVEFEAFSPSAGVRGYARRMWHSEFEKALREYSHKNARLLELGCGGSAYLPYFAKHFGFEVTGIDYSESGCVLARQMCEINEARAEIVCADFFAAPSNLTGVFDVVVSFGVVEHFTDTTVTITSFAKFLREGGILITVVPNMGGLPGWGQKAISQRVYDVHEVITPDRLARAHHDADLKIESNGYFLFSNFGVINADGEQPWFKRLLMLSLRAVTGIVWVFETIVGSFTPNRISSPYVWCIARKEPMRSHSE